MATTNAVSQNHTFGRLGRNFEHASISAILNPQHERVCNENEEYNSMAHSYRLVCHFNCSGSGSEQSRGPQLGHTNGSVKFPLERCEGKLRRYLRDLPRNGNERVSAARMG